MSARKEFEKILLEYSEEATIAGGQMAMETGMMFNFVDEEAIAFLKDNASELSSSSLDRLQGNLDETIAQGVAEGKSQRAIVKDLNGIFDNMAAYETERIARTEVARGVVNGSLLGYGQMEVEKVEFVSNAGACTELCEPLNGTIMTLSEAKGLIPVHPNCECFWIPRPDLNKKKLVT